MVQQPSRAGSGDSALSRGGGGAGGGSLARGGPTSPRAVAPSAAAPEDPGRRHLNRDGSRAETCGARAARRNPEAWAPRGWGSGCVCPGSAVADPVMAQEPGEGASAPPGSQALLDTLLQNLYDFGETEDETEQKRIRKKRENKKRDVGTPATLVAETTPPSGTLVRGQRKHASSFFKELKEELQCAPAAETPADFLSGSAGPGVEASSSPLKNDRKRVEVVEFHSRNKKRKQKLGQEENPKTKTNVLQKDENIQEFNLEKARLEVHRFGIMGYGKGKERVLERERAIMLGAKPPKNSYVNYKVLQEQIKEKKAAKNEEKKMAQDTDFFKKKKRKGQEDRKSKKKKSAPSILSSGRIGQVGKFKNGTLILSQVDIRKINSSRVAK
ncbi:uncharacterized protein C1orf131 homolog [Talpa occidentalis]|uniref:uncharacterized protein C1orf131 homolog n=1 Tax=Talpa occidentalis TaxID=50954 RepID=UPI00188F8425|nr:uncharacterized protein C1orf131 homolog [Talpa occidentalis]